MSFRYSLLHPAPSALIDELVVDTSARGSGVGNKLLSRAIEDAKEIGCSEIEVSTEKSNEKAQEFYKKHGFGREAILLELEF